MYTRLTIPLSCAAALLSAPAAAQPSAAPLERVPVTAGIAYESAYAGYVPYREEALASWRELNDDVGRVAGHKGIFGGAAHQGHASQKPADATAREKPASPAPSAPAHGRGHQ